LSVQLINDVARLRERIAEWEDLAAHAAEPNVYYEPWMLLPALKAFDQDNRVRVLLVYDDKPTGQNGTRRLCGLFPLERVARYRKLPISLLRFWKHHYCLLCSPLVRSGCERVAWSGLFQWITSPPRPASLLELNHMTGDGVVAKTCDEWFQGQKLPTFRLEEHKRAFLRCLPDADTYLQETLSKAFHKKLRQMRNRLNREGRVDIAAPKSPDELDTHLAQFLDLEAGSWKGECGTAIAQSAADLVFFREVIGEGFKRGKVAMPALCLDDKPIAMQVNLFSAPGSFAFKTAYNQDYAKYSPGVLLELENIYHVHAQPEIDWMDSCSPADYPVLNRLWRERRSIRSVLVSTGEIPGNILVRLLPLARLVRRAFLKKKLTAPQSDPLVN
jgi:CelD/BcsL family acetyltransferase involved in cellulose biosynthesis